MATKKNNFEEQLNELQEIVNKLESGNVPLEDALNEFQAGVKLSRELEKKLKRPNKQLLNWLIKMEMKRRSIPKCVSS